MITNVVLHQRNLPKVYLDLHRPPVAGVSQCLNWQIDGGSWGSEVVIISGPSREVARSSRWWPRPSVSCPLQISPHCTTTPSSRTRIISSPCSCYDPSSTSPTSSCQICCPSYRCPCWTVRLAWSCPPLGKSPNSTARSGSPCSIARRWVGRHPGTWSRRHRSFPNAQCLAWFLSAWPAWSSSMQYLRPWSPLSSWS